MNKIQQEALSILQEECAEVVQAISKIFRFGPTNYKPDEPSKTNIEHLEMEIGDVLCIINLLVEYDVVRAEEITKAESEKYDKLKKWSNLVQ